MRPGKRAAELLLHAGADIYRQSLAGKTPLVLAAITGNYDILVLLARRQQELQTVSESPDLVDKSDIELQPGFLGLSSVGEHASRT
ncbi:hypothetical protein AJ79_07069 [Helicocarpus griseus UAMH5409]|uniref:Uncharacterized protein n=1 Tax=Helicocarpus griseus UAMH5409 TaxID=1447875 RepID=A0A2B7X6Z2_9EURO|nr:hypothetical protein AJ79_07069 [Helicocarpus griseus UAMH5409]